MTVANTLDVTTARKFFKLGQDMSKEQLADLVKNIYTLYQLESILSSFYELEEHPHKGRYQA